MAIQIVIVDDDALVSFSLKTIVEASGEIEVLATGSSAEDAVRLYFEHKPDVLMTDIRMNGKTGIDAATEILERDKTAKILFLTTFADDEYIINALKIGAKGYILKQNFEGVNAAVKAVCDGQSVFGDSIVTRLPELLQGKKSFDFASADISEKEQEIIFEVAKGLSNKEIALSLRLSEGTVRNYLSNILEKLELRDRTQLAVFYYKYCV